MNPIRNTSGLIILVFALLVCVTGCKSKKKAMEAAAEKARIEQEAANKKKAEEEAKLRQEKEAADAAEAAKREAEAGAAGVHEVCPARTERGVVLRFPAAHGVGRG